jgi:hypothetical protein
LIEDHAPSGQQTGIEIDGARYESPTTQKVRRNQKGGWACS